MLKNFKIYVGIVGVIILGAVAFFSSVKGPELLLKQNKSDNSGKIVVYKSSTCGCCGMYVNYLKDNGFSVETVNTEDMTSIKEKYGIPEEMTSCHTAVVGGYFVEGHIPIEAINKLLIEKPIISGIALPGMPSGAPGMGGRKEGKFVVYGLPSSDVPFVFLEL